MIHIVGTNDNRLILSTSIEIAEDITIPNAYVMPLKNARGETVDILSEVRLPPSDAIFYHIYLKNDLQNKEGDINPQRIEIRDMINKAKQLAAAAYLTDAMTALPPKSYKMAQLKRMIKGLSIFGDLTYIKAVDNFGPIFRIRKIECSSYSRYFQEGII
ncbi:MAG: hypothetical protein KO464_05685 [Candidatus Methanofastidiosum sp.]|nr:hypothetical protein [Methanofastidiosum sp.]